MITSEELLDQVRNAHDERDLVSAFAFQCREHRSQMLAQLRECAPASEFVFISVVDQSLSSANSIQSNIMNAIDGHRLDVTRAIRDHGHCILLFLTKDPVAGDSSSEVILPNWVPVQGGKTCYVPFRNVSESAIVSFDALRGEASVLSSSLFYLESALRIRLAAARKRKEDDVRLSLIALTPTLAVEDLDTLLDRWHEPLKCFPQAFRPNCPSVKNAEFILSFLCRISRETSPALLLKLCSPLSTLFVLGDASEMNYLPISLVLNYGGPPLSGKTAPTQEQLLGLVLLHTSLVSVQFLNCLAHADSYGGPPKVLSGASADLTLSIAALNRALEQPDVCSSMTCS